jgi:anti-sigma factor RsiW
MNCNEFVDRYSEYHDDEGSLPDRERFEAHLASCGTCRRYRDVVVRGTSLLRELPEPPYREDFRDRLQHRLYLSEVEDRPGRSPGMTTPVTLGLAAAAILTVAATFGALADAVLPLPEASLPPIMASVPPGQVVPASIPGSARAPAALVQPDYWVQSHTLLYEHSSLYHRSRQGGLVRAGIQ